MPSLFPSVNVNHLLGPGFVGDGKPSSAGQGGGRMDKKVLKENSDANVRAAKLQENQPKWWTRVLRTMGIQMGIAGILKQSQVFTSILGSFFQIMGAFVDIFLAPWLPIIVPGLRKLANQFPKMRKAAETFFNWSMNTLFPVIRRMWQFLTKDMWSMSWWGEQITKAAKTIGGTLLNALGHIPVVPKGLGDKMLNDAKGPGDTQGLGPDPDDLKKGPKRGSMEGMPWSNTQMIIGGTAAALATGFAAQVVKKVVEVPIKIIKTSIQGLVTIARAANTIAKVPAKVLQFINTGGNRLPGDIGTGRPRSVASVAPDRMPGGKGTRSGIVYKPTTPTPTGPTSNTAALIKRVETQGLGPDPDDFKKGMTRSGPGGPLAVKQYEESRASTKMSNFNKWVKNAVSKLNIGSPSDLQAFTRTAIQKSSELITAVRGTRMVSFAIAATGKLMRFIPWVGAAWIAGETTYDLKQIYASNKPWMYEKGDWDSWAAQIGGDAAGPMQSILASGGGYGMNLRRSEESMAATDAWFKEQKRRRDVMGVFAAGKGSDLVIRAASGYTGAALSLAPVVGQALGFGLEEWGKNTSVNRTIFGNPQEGGQYGPSAYEAGATFALNMLNNLQLKIQGASGSTSTVGTP